VPVRAALLVAMSLVAVSAKNIDALQPVQSQSKTCEITCSSKPVSVAITGGTSTSASKSVWAVDVVDPFTCDDCTPEYLTNPANTQGIVDALNKDCTDDCLTVDKYTSKAGECAKITTACS